MINSLNGRQKEFGIDPLLTSFLGSGSFPLNRSLLLASTISKFAKPSIAIEMLWPLLIMILAYMFLFGAFLLKRTSAELVVREKRTRWIKTVIFGDENNV